MEEFLIEPIVLSGGQSEEFINSLRRPSKEYLDKVAGIFSKIDREISIQHDNMNLEVEIPGLDLSFIDAMDDDKHISDTDSNIEMNTEVSFIVKINSERVNLFTGIYLGHFETVSVIQMQEKSMTKRKPCVYNETGKEIREASVKNKEESLSGVCQMSQIIIAA